MNFHDWFLTFIEEKNLDLDGTFEVEGESGTNFFTYQVIADHIFVANSKEQKQIKDILVKIDFANGDVLHFFRHLGQALAK